MSNLVKLKHSAAATNLCRNFSLSARLMKMDKAKAFRKTKYRRPWEEPRSSQRSTINVLLNRGLGKTPFYRKMPVTGKNTGLGVEGGSDIAQKLAAVHRVQPVGYVNKSGQFMKVKDMVPEFIVPDLKDFKLEAYVPYSVSKIERKKHTAREIFDEYEAETIKQKFYSENETKTPRKSFLSKFRS
ncbi:39S ribosomal protein L41 [Mactra antiquata]